MNGTLRLTLQGDSTRGTLGLRRLDLSQLAKVRLTSTSDCTPSLDSCQLAIETQRLQMNTTTTAMTPSVVAVIGIRPKGIGAPAAASVCFSVGREK